MRIPFSKQPLHLRGRFYVVQFGDSLYLISQRFGVSVANLLSFNDQLSGEHTLFPGEVLFIPAPPVRTTTKDKRLWRP